MTDIDCALSGKVPPADALVTDAKEESELEELPIGWIEVRFTRRLLNPMHVAALQVREQLAQGMIQNTENTIGGPLGEEEQNALRLLARLQTPGVETIAEFERYIEEPIVFYVSDPENDPKVKQALRQILKTLGADEDAVAVLLE